MKKHFILLSKKKYKKLSKVILNNFLDNYYYKIGENKLPKLKKMCRISLFEKSIFLSLSANHFKL